MKFRCLLKFFFGAVLCMQQVGCQYYRSNYEYMVSIVTKKSNKLLCGGAVIDDLWVLTAAQCTMNQNISTIQVRSGSVYLAFAKRYNVVEIHDHPSYDSVCGTHDISLIKVSKSMTYCSKTCDDFGTVKIPYAKIKTNYADVDVSIAGWGLTEHGVPTSLNYLTQKVLSHDSCISETRFDANYIADKICTIKPTYPESGACNRDEGGPVVYASCSPCERGDVNTVIGIITRVSCGNGTPDISTRVDEHADWIGSVISNELYE